MHDGMQEEACHRSEQTNEEGENLEGSLYLENKEVGDIEPGEEIAIYKP